MNRTRNAHDQVQATVAPAISTATASSVVAADGSASGRLGSGDELGSGEKLRRLSGKLRRGILWAPLFDISKWVSDYEQVKPQPSTLNPQLSTLSPQPSTLNPNPGTLDPYTHVPRPKPETRNPESGTTNPEPRAPETVPESYARWRWVRCEQVSRMAWDVQVSQGRQMHLLPVRPRPFF